jgi:hypothetical protein
METFESLTSPTDYVVSKDDYPPIPEMPEEYCVETAGEPIPTLRYDVMGNTMRPRFEEYNDPESQKIKREFKRPPY